MVAAMIADGKKLARVLVPRQLLESTATLLKTRLGGLVGRGIRELPYSRRTNPSRDVARVYFETQKHMKKNAGILLAAPEHIMSFKLCGLQQLSDGNLKEADPMVKIQDWLNVNARDIVDESDFVFSPRTALCFPSGNQTMVDHHPHRWRTIETLLKLVEGNVSSLQFEMKGSIEVKDRQNGGFPFVYFLRRQAEELLLLRIVDQLLSEHSVLPTKQFTEPQLAAIREFISTDRPSEDAVSLVGALTEDQPEVRNTIHLLRGLIVHRILLLTLRKRWSACSSPALQIWIMLLTSI